MVTTPRGVTREVRGTPEIAKGGAIDRRRIPTSGLVPAATVWVDQQWPRRRIIQQRKASRISRGANTSGGSGPRALPDVDAAFGATRRLP